MKSCVIRSLLATATYLITTVAAAQSLGPSSSDALALVDRWGFDSKYNQNVPMCSQSSGTLLDPRHILEINGDYFGGIRPGRAGWNEIEAIYGRIKTVVCSSELSNRWKRRFATELDVLVSASDLRIALADEASPEAKHVAKVLHRLEAILWPNANQFTVLAIALTQQEFQSEVDDVVRRARAK